MLKAYETSGKVLFEETQKYPKWVSWLVRSGMLITILGLLIALLAEKDKTEVLIALGLVVPIAALAIYFNSNIQLEKIVTSNGLYYRWKPWHKRFRVIEKEVISSVDKRKFPFLNYGFGWFPTYGWHHNAGREGVQLYLKNGNKFFFSANNAELFEKTLQSLISNPKVRLREL